MGPTVEQFEAGYIARSSASEAALLMGDTYVDPGDILVWDGQQSQLRVMDEYR